MATSIMERGDLIASNMEKVPDEAYVAFSAASVFASIGLFLSGHREEALFVGLLGSAFGTMAGIMKLVSLQRNARMV
jgi:hypothetical protein